MVPTARFERASPRLQLGAKPELSYIGIVVERMGNDPIRPSLQNSEPPLRTPRNGVAAR